jgi:hypothetical protein
MNLPHFKQCSLTTVLLLMSANTLAVNVTVSESTPTIFFNDTSAAAPYEWTTTATANASGTNGNYMITSWHSNTIRNILELDDDTPSALVANQGVVSLANNTVKATMLGGTSPRVAIGGDFTANPFSMYVTNPGIEMEDSDNGAYMELKLATQSLIFTTGLTEAHAEQSVIFDLDAPTASLKIDLTGNVGFGTSFPSQAVDVARNSAAARFQLTSYTENATEAPQYIQRRGRGTSSATPSPVQANDNLGLFSFRGYNGTTMGGSRATITAQAAGNFTNSSTPTRLIFATTPVGQTVPQQVLVITPDGKVQVSGQNLNVPDYVFEDDYELMPLEELQAFIDANGHLPGIANADEVSVEGHDLAGSDMAHLRKIEELTLYTLQQQQQLGALGAENEQLRNELVRLQQDHASMALLLKRLGQRFAMEGSP